MRSCNAGEEQSKRPTSTSYSFIKNRCSCRWACESHGYQKDAQFQEVRRLRSMCGRIVWKSARIADQVPVLSGHCSSLANGEMRGQKEPRCEGFTISRVPGKLYTDRTISPMVYRTPGITYPIETKQAVGCGQTSVRPHGCRLLSQVFFS